jgi:hypothetical protein
VKITVATPGGGTRVFRITDDQWRRTYFPNRASAVLASTGENVKPLEVHDLDWGKLRAEGYRYVYLGSYQGDPEHRILDRIPVLEDKSLRTVFEWRSAEVLEILPQD